MLPGNEKMTKIHVGRFNGKTTQAIYTSKSCKMDFIFVSILHNEGFPDEIDLFSPTVVDGSIIQNFKFDSPNLLLRFNYNDTLIERLPVIENIDVYSISGRNFFTREYSLEFITTITESDVCNKKKNTYKEKLSDDEILKNLAVEAAYEILNL